MHLITWHPLSWPCSCVGPLLPEDLTSWIPPTQQWAAQGMWSYGDRKGQGMAVLVDCTKTSCAEKHAVTEHSTHCVFPPITQMNSQLFLKQSGQKNIRDWLNDKDSHILIAFFHAWSWHKCLILEALHSLYTLMVFAKSNSWMSSCGIADFCAIGISSETWEMLIASFAVFPWWSH